MGSHRYVRFCIDGDKFHSSGTFNDLYSKDIAKVEVGKGFPFDLFTIPSYVFDKKMMLGSHTITLIFFKRHAACRANRTIEKICEIDIDYGIVSAIKIASSANVVVTKPHKNYELTSYAEFARIIDL